jgi:hypothetical protein
MGPIGCPETSVWNYHYTLCHIPEERRALVSFIFALRFAAKTRYVLPQARLCHWVCYFAVVTISCVIGFATSLKLSSPSAIISYRIKKMYQVARTIHNCTHIQYYEELATAKIKVGLLSLLVVVVIISIYIIIIIIIVIFTVIAINMEIPSTFRRGSLSSPWPGRQIQDYRRQAVDAGTDRKTSTSPVVSVRHRQTSNLRLCGLTEIYVEPLKSLRNSVDLIHTKLSQLLNLLLCFKPECRGFGSRWCHWNFS